MNLKTGLSIYNKQWLIEPTAALQMLDFWEKVKAGDDNWNYKKAKGEAESDSLSAYKIHQQFFSKENVVMAPDNQWDMMDFKGFEGASVAIIPVMGPLMKSDFCGIFGTSTLTQLTQKASNTDSVHTIIFLHDSPGGTVDGTETFAQAIAASNKRTISLIGGMMCSADYWIGCHADEIYATSNTDIIGSIGTMCAFYDNTDAMKQKGVVLREYYATASKDKNKASREAQQGNGKALIQETLDPLNNIFLKAVREARAGKINTSKEDVLTGKTYTSENALMAGLIDGIKSFESVLTDAIESGHKNPIQPQTTIITEQKIKNMTLSELKEKHPEAYQAAFNAGAESEQSRVKAWMVYNDVDSEAVTKGISEGKELSRVDMAEFGKKMLSKQKLEAISADSPNAIKTTEEEAAKTAQEQQLAKFNQEVKQNIKNFKN